jgi:hypothetical protein
VRTFAEGAGGRPIVGKKVRGGPVLPASGLVSPPPRRAKNRTGAKNLRRGAKIAGRARVTWVRARKERSGREKHATTLEKPATGLEKPATGRENLEWSAMKAAGDYFISGGSRSCPRVVDARRYGTRCAEDLVSCGHNATEFRVGGGEICGGSPEACRPAGNPCSLSAYPDRTKSSFPQMESIFARPESQIAPYRSEKPSRRPDNGVTQPRRTAPEPFSLSPSDRLTARPPDRPPPHPAKTHT